MTAVLAAELQDIFFHDGPWTEEAFFELPARGPKIELLDGELLVSPAPRQPHQLISGELLYALKSRQLKDFIVVHDVNVRLGPQRILIPDLVVTREQGDILVHDPRLILLVIEIRSPSNRGPGWLEKYRLYAQGGIPWFLLVEAGESGYPTLILLRLDGGNYVEHARAEGGEKLVLPEPLGEIDPGSLIRR